MFCILGGGGLKGGQIVGSTNAKGEVPQDRPLRPGDIHHTIYHVLGVDPNTHFLNHSGRPIPAIDPGEVIRQAPSLLLGLTDSLNRRGNGHAGGSEDGA